MTLVAAELAVLIAVLVAVLVFGWLAARQMLARHDSREAALNRHAKAVAREPLAVLREAQDVLAKTQAVRDDAQLLYARVDRLAAELKHG